MLTKIDYGETIYDTTYHDFKPGREGVVIMNGLKRQAPSKLGMVIGETTVTRGMRLGTSLQYKEKSSAEKFPYRYRKWDARVQGLVSEIRRFQVDDIRRAMFTVHKAFLDFEREKDYAACDDMLRSLDVAELDLKVLMSLLMASNPVKAHLSYRQVFYARVEKRSHLLDSFDKVRSLFDRLK